MSILQSSTLKNKKVYFFESNIPMDKTVYLPFVSGILQAYAQTFKVINDNYKFMPFIFIRDTPINMIKNIIDPYLIAFSVCIWNHQLSLAVAKLIKQKYPECKIVFGGPQVNQKDKSDVVDYVIENEGENQFVELLASLAGEKIEMPEYNLDNYPSPYSAGLYDDILKDNPDLNFQAIVETNRYCPFSCTFCFWGNPHLVKKIKFHSLEHIQKEAEWIGKNRIKYVFMADANFGMYERDYDVAKIYCDVKDKYGYPDKIRVCYGKNKEDNVFKVAKLLSTRGLAKAVTLARQSNNKETLKNIRRDNIKLDVYESLGNRYAQEGMPTYTEIILGLPGETVESFKNGVNDVSGGPTQLFIYHCSVLPNTEMASEEYIKKHGIKTVRVPLTEIHAEIRNPEFVQEYENIIIETSTMSKSEWIDCAVYSWVMQLKHSFDTDVTMVELDRFEKIALSITNGSSRAQVDLRFGNIYWEPEELAYLRISLDQGLIDGDLKEWAKINVLWGRKSKLCKTNNKKLVMGRG